MTTRIAILGGAFDPPTLGHIDAARVVLGARLGVAQVWLTPVVGHRFGKAMSSSESRFTMCKLAAADAADQRIMASDYEIRHALPGDTYSLLSRLNTDAQYQGHNEFSFIIGQDNAQNFHRWHRAEELKRLAPFIVLPRQGIAPDSATWTHEPAPWYTVAPHVYLATERPVLQSSSTQARSMIASGQSAVELIVSPGVLAYIRAHDLYR